MASKKYTIVKYKGKTKIKDTKTGKSAEIDIEKFMNGGYKTLQDSYAYGGKKENKKFVPNFDDGGDCGKLHVVGSSAYNDCMKSKQQSARNIGYEKWAQNRIGEDTKIDWKSYKQEDGSWDYSSLKDNINQPKYNEQGILDLKGMQFNSDNASNDAGVADTDLTQGVNDFTYNDEMSSKYKDVDLSLDSYNKELKESQEYNKSQQGYNMPNPYAGVDIPTAAYTLGKSIKDKNTLGTVASSLKLVTGLGRNVVSGLGQANRYNQVMGDYYEEQKKKKNPTQWVGEDGGYLESFAYGGKKEEELATGEYMRGQEDPNAPEVNAEVEQGEYFQTNQGDVSEVVGDKHSQGGERIAMEPEDRVLSDKLNLGNKTAKMLASKYDLKLKGKNTYSDVLDKFRKKMKLDKIVEEESMYLKKIAEQENVEDQTTKNLNLQVLAEKVKEIREQKHPIEEFRKEIFDELFTIQEDSKPKDKKTNQKNLADGGMLESLAKEYNIPLERAQELVQNFSKGGELKDVPKYVNGVEIGDTNPKTGKKVTKEEAEKNVKEGLWKDLGDGRYLLEGTPDSEKTSTEKRKSTGKGYLTRWNELTENEKNNFQNYEDFEKKAKQWNEENNKIITEKIPGTPDQFFYTENDNKTEGNKKQEEEVIDNAEMLPYLFPDESPLPPTALQGTLKIEPRYDRVRPSEIDVAPYLQDIQDREQAQVQSLEGLSPNVRAAVLANMRANSNKQESDVRNKIDTANIGSQEKAIYTNAQIQQREENSNNRERLMYEMRQHKAQANTDNDVRNYINAKQDLNATRFTDIHNMNLINNSQEDMYFDGQNFRRKVGSSDEEMRDKFIKMYENPDFRKKLKTLDNKK